MMAAEGTGNRMTTRRLVNRPGTSEGLVFMFGLLVAVLGGAVVAGAIRFPLGSELPVGVSVLTLCFLGTLPLLLGQWRLTALLLLVWLILEDLFRKFAGNDIRVYFVKDLIFVALIAGVLAAREVRGVWKRAAGKERLLLYAMVAWAVVLSIPTGMRDWRLPLIGLRLNFMYIPLVAVGFLLASDMTGFRTWLRRMSVVAGIASAVGVAQAALGPQFLSPDRATPGLTNLVLIRGTAESGAIYRPTGTFVDPGRFVSIAFVGLAVALAAALANRDDRGGGRRKIHGLVVLSSLACGAGVWVSGGRAALLGALFVLAFVVVSPFFGERRFATVGRTSGRAFVLVISIVVAVAAISPILISSRSDWYRQTLDLRSSDNEWSSRFDSYWTDTVRGVTLGGLFGQGTGQESLGRQYIFGGDQRLAAGIQVEGGYASVAVEWGGVGLALWLLWTVTWSRRLWMSVKSAKGTPLSAPGLVLIGWIVFFLFIGFFSGLQNYQNYIANAFFWLLSGMVFALPKIVVAQESHVASELTHAT